MSARPILALSAAVLFAAASGSAAVAERFAAIAHSPSTDAWGRSWNYATEDVARREAMGYCVSHSNAGDCAVVQILRSPDRGPEQCGALVSVMTGGRGPDGVRVEFRRVFISVAGSKSEAETKAQALCTEAVAAGEMSVVTPCRMRASVCSRSK